MKNSKKPTASISFQILPLHISEKESLVIINKVIQFVRASGVAYEVGPMETTMEGNLDTLLEIVKKSQKIGIKNGAKSIFTNVKIIYNPEGVMTISQKINKYR